MEEFDNAMVTLLGLPSRRVVSSRQRQFSWQKVIRQKIVGKLADRAYYSHDPLLVEQLALPSIRRIHPPPIGRLADASISKGPPLRVVFNVPS